MATSARLYHCQQFGAIPESSPGQLTDQQVLAKLHALGVRFVRFSRSKRPFDPRHRTWGLELDALLRTHADPGLHVGWIPASVGMTVVDVDSGDWLPLVKEHPPAYHAASRTPGRRHLMYRDREARADVNGWEAAGCHGDVRSAGPVILYDAPRLLAALDIGVGGVTFPTGTVTGHRPTTPKNDEGTPANLQQEPGTPEGNPIPPSKSPWEGDKATVTAPLPLPAQESSQPQSLFDRLRYWAYSHVADAGDPEAWLEAVQRQAEALVATVPDPENYSAARVRTTARSVSAWTWERRDGFTGGWRDVDSAAQAWRARRRAEAVWEAHAGRDAEIVRLSLAGYSQRVIARSVGISPMTVNRVLNRLEEAEDGAPELRMDAIEPAPNNQEVSDARTEREPFSDGPGPRLEALDGAGWTEGMADQMPRMPRVNSATRASAAAEPHGELSVPELRPAHGGGVRVANENGILEAYRNGRWGK